ncbi:uncharacterized protein LOC130138000 isoform X2 [Syzygium oleosum]|uniref:uncharacterized protein LOC130138000 isoform X2 n=1 Tax=Syzygium oleosum TaxID=219896 RepID=UPI0024B8C325|nr:uncharacterized protein LOC130138000 isoform X2 [Syzygium oleosum]
MSLTQIWINWGHGHRNMDPSGLVCTFRRRCSASGLTPGVIDGAITHQYLCCSGTGVTMIWRALALVFRLIYIVATCGCKHVLHGILHLDVGDPEVFNVYCDTRINYIDLEEFEWCYFEQLFVYFFVL